MNMLLEPETAMARAIVSSISWAVLLLSMMLAGAAPPKAVTVLVSGAKPRSTWSGAQGLSASFSAKQQVYLAGLPSVDLSACCGTPPPIVVMISRVARPIVALARKPGPNKFPRALTPISRPTGPLTMSTGLAGFVVPWMPYRLNCLLRIAFTAVTITGKYSGLHPAITALTASVAIVASPQRGGIGPSEKDGSRSLKISIRATRSSVGGTIGIPSVQPSLANRSKIASGSSATVMRVTNPWGASKGPPNPPALGRAPAEPWRASLPSVPVSVAISTIDAITGSARPRISRCGTLTIGCRTYTAGRLGWPRLLVTMSYSVRNSSVTIVAVGMPRFSNSMLSWTLHDVQDPQSAIPLITTAHSRAAASSISSGTGSAAAFLS